MVSDADLEAARLLVGDALPSDPRMQNLPGADRCRHILNGAGNPADVSPWYSASYRHHGHVLDAGNPYNGMTYPGAPRYCKCGNSPGHIIHRRCDL